MSTQQSLKEPHIRRREKPVPATSTIKTILFHVLDAEPDDHRIDCALSLANACSAHLSCVHVTAIEAYVAFDRLGGIFVMNDVMRRIDERNVRLRKKAEERLASADITWDYQQVTASVAPTLVRRAALADLVITGRETPNGESTGPTIGFLSHLLDQSRTPLLIPAAGQEHFDAGGVAIIAWDGSLEAANAVRSSLGLLAMAKDVRLVEVREKRNDDRKGFPGTAVLEYLSRHGIHAQLQVEDAPSPREDVVSGMIVAQALGAGASYIVMGAYGHRRLAEYVFGGVTRTLLKDCPLPLVITH